MIGRTYLLYGRPVTVVQRWGARRGGDPMPANPRVRVAWAEPGKPPPRNVLIRMEDGTLLVRSFRGLRRAP